ncbi:MAG TPA: hypothetical protein DEA55_01035 [Rhodospirillaceae bacterium]|nr:hypothetical protein [Rhodospirillaceae bacterium]
MPSSRFLFLALSLGLLPVATACAYFLEDTYQDLTIVTPGAHGAVCVAEIDGLEYKFSPPETISVTKSRKDMLVDCMAPGNRRKKLTVEPDISALTVAGAPGAPWDYASEAMFKYPEIIEVNFNDTPWADMPLPAQNNPDIKQPEEYDLEEFRPAFPAMNADRHVPKVELQRRNFEPAEENVYYPDYGKPDSADGPFSDTVAAPAEDGAVSDKGDLMKASGVSANDMNPGAYGPSPASKADIYGPVQNYPVE